MKPNDLQQSEYLIHVDNVSKSFAKDRSQALLVLENIKFHMAKGEIVALLGKSGSGKSTLLRIISGLVKASSGEVFYRGKVVKGPVPGISMVFQNFALMPWLTVLQNVELGLEALGVAREERRARALKAIDTIGLDGFESAFPKELSGGMRQRVGFARALVVEPDILLMDEPFSALDVLTADNLRSDLLDLWLEKKTRTSGILFVTHNIDEAVMMADRIIIFGSEPGHIHAELAVDLPYPRSESDAEFAEMVDKIYALMTRKMPLCKALHAKTDIASEGIGIGYRLPDSNISELTGLLEVVNEPEYAGEMDLPELADELPLDIDELFPLTEVLEILRFAQVSEGDIALTEAGKSFADADILERKKIFAKHLVKYVPLARHIRQILDEKTKHRSSEEPFLGVLEEYLSEKEAARVLTVVIDWGRYAELFAYDFNARELSLENPD